MRVDVKSSHPRPSVVTAPVYRGCPAGTHRGDPLCTDVCGCPVYTSRRFSGTPSRKPKSPHPPSIFWNSFQETENHHHFSEDAGCHEFQIVCHCEVGHCEVEDDNAAGGFPIGFVVDAVDVLDVSVSEIAAFPPGEHLAFSSIIYSPISFGPSSVSNVLKLSESSYGSSAESSDEFLSKSLHKSAKSP